MYQQLFMNISGHHCHDYAIMNMLINLIYTQLILALSSLYWILTIRGMCITRITYKIFVYTGQWSLGYVYTYKGQSNSLAKVFLYLRLCLYHSSIAYFDRHLVANLYCV